jgi:hypothetical protein
VRVPVFLSDTTGILLTHGAGTLGDMRGVLAIERETLDLAANRA